MENVVEAGRRGRQAGGNGGESAVARGAEWRNLVADVEDLIKKVANVDNAEIAEMRARVEQTLARVKGVAKDGAANVRGYAREATAATDEYVHDSPWSAIGVAAAVGVLIGFLSARR